MGNVNVGQGHKIPLSATAGPGTANYVLGDVSDTWTGAWMVQIVNVSLLVVSIVVKARARNADEVVPFVPINYIGLYINGATGVANALVTTAITTNSLILIPASGQSISLEVTFTSGNGMVYCWPVTSGSGL